MNLTASFTSILIFLSLTALSSYGQTELYQLTRAEFENHCFAEEVTVRSGQKEVLRIEPINQNLIRPKKLKGVLYQLTNLHRYPALEFSLLESEYLGTQKELRIPIKIPNVSKPLKYQLELLAESGQTVFSLKLNAFPAPILAPLSELNKTHDFIISRNASVESKSLESFLTENSVAPLVYDRYLTTATNNTPLIISFAMDEHSLRDPAFENWKRTLVISEADSSKISQPPLVRYQERVNGSKQVTIPVSVIKNLRESPCRQRILLEAVQRVLGE